jgi:hypothetical protein
MIPELQINTEMMGWYTPDGGLCHLVALMWSDEVIRPMISSTICDLMLAGF